MQPGQYCGKTVVEADLDSARFSGATEEELMDMEDNVCPSFGAGPSMGTANTMQMLGEVLNLVLPGTSTIPTSVPPGESSRAKPSSIVSPRSFSSWSRSGFTPVSAWTRELLP